MYASFGGGIASVCSVLVTVPDLRVTHPNSNSNNCLPLMRLLSFLLLALSLAAASKDDRPSGPNHDLTKEINFRRLSTFPLGPTGAHGWMYVNDQMTTEARQILITEVEPGSPADGILQDGDVILGIGGKRFDSDARRALGWAIVEVQKQANKGRLQLTRWRPVADAATRQGVESEVTLQLPVLGSFSTTAPYDCAVSAKLLETALERVMVLAREKKFGRLQENLLALMAVGRPEQMAIVRDYLHEVSWAKPDFTISVERGSKSAWGAGIHGLILAEYYLATGDDYVLPALRETAVKVAMGQSGGGLWGHGFAYTLNNNGKLHGSLGGYGALNLAGLPCLLTLVLAEHCDIHHPEISTARERALPFFANFVGHGTIGYGYHRPSLDHYNNGHNGFSSNGKNAIAGIVHTLVGDREVSNYYAMLTTSSYDEREYGHAGNSFNRFWGMMGASTGGPKAVAAFKRELHWYDALCRGWDGRMLYQKLGGYYGGPTLDLEAAQVLANALPLRKLIITGRTPKKDLWLSDKQVDEAIAAGRWHFADYSDIRTPDLIAALDCWSPGAREWMAVELGRRKGDIVTPLTEALASDSADMRAGAAAALGYQGKRAGSALPALTRLLWDREAPVRVAATYAIMRMGPPGRKAVPDMLKAIVDLEGEGPLQPTLQALSYSLGAEYMETAPLYFVGILPQFPKGVNPLDGIDRDILYAAFRRMATDRSGRIRDCGAYMLRWFDREDLKANAWEIYNLVEERAPDYGMFSGRARGHGIDILARFQITEGPALTTYSIDTQGWGWFMISPHHFEALQQYGSLARGVLPWLYASRQRWSSGESRAILEATIAAIETDKKTRQGLSLIDLVDERISQDASNKDLRHLIHSQPHDHLLHVAALRRLVARPDNATQADLLQALASEHGLVRTEAVRLAEGRPAIRPAATSDRQAIGILAITQDVALARTECANEHAGRRLAAIQALARLGSKDDLPALIARLNEAEEAEQSALANTIAALATDLRPLEEALPNATPSAQGALLQAIAAVGSPDAIELLLAKSADRNGHIRNAANLALPELPGVAATERLVGMAELSSDRRRRSDIANILYKRLIAGHVAPRSEVPLIDAIIRLGNNAGTTTRALQQLPWYPSIEGLRLAQEHLEEAPAGRAEQARSAAAAQAIIDLAPSLKATDELRAAVKQAKALLKE
jgi:hypothetical protein